MTENNDDRTPNLGEGLSRIIKLGVGAVAGAVEKGVGFVDELTTEGTEANKRAAALGEQFTRKGEQVLDKTAKFGSQFKDKVVEAVNSVPVGYENLVSTLEELTDEQLGDLKSRLDALIAKRAAQEPQEEEPQPPEEPQQ